MVQFRGTNDTTIQRGHEFFLVAQTSSSGTGALNSNAAYNLTLNNISDRCAALGKLFERWQLLDLTVTFVPSVGSTTNGGLAIGIDDDIVESENNGSNTTYAKVMSLRNSATTQLYNPVSLHWKPTDRKKMYYCDANGSTLITDNTLRLVAPCSIFAQGTTSNLNGAAAFGYYRFDYVIKFAGAITPSNLTKAVPNGGITNRGF